MEYRKLPHGNEMIGTLGIGLGGLQASNESEIETIIARAIINKINFFDCAFGDKKIIRPFAKIIAPLRSNVYLQMHFGAVFEENGEYGWSRSLDKIKRTIDYELTELKTSYMDFGMLHCVDTMDDFNLLEKAGVIKYIEKLQKQRVIRHIGFSSHTPQVASEIIDKITPDIMMFSINPAYDFEKGDEYGVGSIRERKELYAKCEEKGVGISVMKPFFGGKLLKDSLSPFGISLTPSQCIQYALDRPATLVALAGIQNSNQLDSILKYLNDDKDKDYSVLGSLEIDNMAGVCVYCNHCQPCPKKLDIATINKYYDLAIAGDKMASGHYDKLMLKADNCTHCKKCNEKCPFGVDQSNRMKEISEYFGK